MVLVTACNGCKRIGLALAKATRDEFLLAFHARIYALRFRGQQCEVACIMAIEGQMIIYATRLLKLRKDYPIDFALECCS